MKNIECNKIIASLLIPGIIFLFVTNLVDILYKPDDVKADYATQNQEQSVASASSDSVIDFDKMLMIANPEKGKVVAKKCNACHTFEKGGANRVGPNLWNIIGAKKAHSSSFNYSKAMTSQSGLWDVKELAHYLRAPQKLVPGTKMSFAGISKDEDIANLISYLKLMSDNQGGK